MSHQIFHCRCRASRTKLSRRHVTLKSTIAARRQLRFYGSRVWRLKATGSRPSLFASATAVLLCLYSGYALNHVRGSLRPRCDTQREFMDDDDRTPVRIQNQERYAAAQVSWLRGHASNKPDHDVPGEHKPPAQSRLVVDGQEKDIVPKPSSTSSFTDKLNNIQWDSMTDRIKDFIVPDWIKLMPGYMHKLQDEFSMAPGSLAEEIWAQANDPEINPEIVWDARVRISNDLCDEEKAFLRMRKVHTTRALARYLGIPEQDVHPDDVPTIAVCGSGGGLRALIAGASSYLASKEVGLFDCVTYTAAVSGSCWLQTLFYSSIGAQNHNRIINHLKSRLGVHLAYPPAALNLMISAPTNKFLLTGVLEKLRGVPDADFGIVDVYGMLLAARLLVPRGELRVDADDLKLSNQRKYIDHGQHPLPIYTAVRHEIPIEQQDTSSLEEAKAQARSEAWFQWFEFTPFEFWCEEMEAGIPTWATGRKFDNGKSVWRENGLSLPELRIPLLLGVWGSAFCATLSHYYHEISPVMKGLVGFTGINQMIADRDNELIKVHPIDPAAIPNFAVGMEDLLPPTCPKSLFESSHLLLMDAGMSNNIPIYPILRPGRDVDVMICFDHSADCKSDNWLKVADGYARQRGIKGWPIGIGWPPADEAESQLVAGLSEAQASTEQEAEQKLSEAQEHDDRPQPKKPLDLGYCNIWVGSTQERTSEDEPPPSKLVEEDWELMNSDAGVTIVYFPLVPNPKVPGVDPQSTDFMSTWNFVYTPEQVDKCSDLARANFEAGAEQTKRTVRAVYERKKQRRLEREIEEREMRRRRKMRMGLVGKRLGEGDHADHFS